MIIRSAGPGPGPDSGLHATHDRALIAARAAGDLRGPDLELADSLRSTCSSCRELHDDLVAIATATRHLPAPTRPAALDFTISSERAATLARGDLWRRLLRPFGRSGSWAGRPLAAALTTIGFAGLLLAALPGLQLGSAAGGFLNMAAAPSEVPRDAQAPTAAPEIVQPGSMASPGATGGDTAGGETGVDTSNGYGPAVPTADGKGALPTPARNAEGNEDVKDLGSTESGGPTGAARDGSGDRMPLAIMSLGLLLAGLGLFLVRRIAVRMR